MSDSRTDHLSGNTLLGAGVVHHINRDQMHCRKKALLFDYLVGARQQHRRHGNTECISGLEIDRQSADSHRKISRRDD
jgi:hypothetical protein